MTSLEKTNRPADGLAASVNPHGPQAVDVKDDLATGTFEHKDHDGKVDVENAEPEFDPVQRAKTMRKIDLVVVPVLMVILAFCYIDRTNMGLAAVAGMNAELGLQGYQYSIVLLVFFPGYVVCALPSNYALSRTSVRYWLVFLSIGFGAFTLGSGLVRNFQSLAVMRVFLGMFEAGVFPAVITVLSSWYPRYAFGKRMTLLNTGAAVISSLSGVLGFAFSRINVPNYAGWRWIFLIEGALTIVVAVIAYFFIDEYPDRSRFLTSEQKELIVALIDKDREEHSEEKLSVRLILQCLRDWKLWVFGSLYMLGVTTTYGLAYFVPLILNNQLGFTGAISQLLSTPPYVFAFILALIVSYYSDKMQMRAPFISGLCGLAMLGAVLTRWGPNVGAQYVGLMFAFSGALVAGPMIITFAQNNAPTRSKRSVSAALQLTMGAIGGIIGSTVFRSQDAPTYTPGMIVVLCANASIICICGCLFWYFRKLNRQHGQPGRVFEGQTEFLYTP